MDSESFSFLFSSIDFQILFEFLILVILLGCSAFVSGAEVALFSLSQSDLAEAKLMNPDRGKLIEEMIQKPKKLLATILIVNNFVNIAIVLVFYNISITLFSGITSFELKFFIDVVVVTFLILFFG